MAGYVVEHELARAGRGERRYAVRGPAGDRATPVSRRGDRSRGARPGRGFTFSLRVAPSSYHPGAIRVRAVADHHGAGALITDEYPECTFADLLDGLRSRLSVWSRCSRRWRRRSTSRTLTGSCTATSMRRASSCSGGGACGSTPSDPPERRRRRRRVGASANVEDIRYVPPDPLRGEPLGAGGDVYWLGALIIERARRRAPIWRRPCGHDVRAHEWFAAAEERAGARARARCGRRGGSGARQAGRTTGAVSATALVR